MNRPGRPIQTIVFGVLAAALLIVLAPRTASAAPPVVANDPARPSAITVTDATTYVLYAYNVAQAAVCLGFVNHGPRTATKVGFSLAYVDATGTVLGVEVMYPTGKFLVDKRSAFSGSRDAIALPNGNCHASIAYGKTPSSTFNYRGAKGTPSADVAAILVSAREIVYEDGTVWRSDQVPQTGDRVTLPAAPPFTAAVPDGPPRLTTAAVAGAPFAVTDIFATEGAGQEMVGAGNFHVPVIMRSRGVCVLLKNQDAARTAKKVMVDFVIVDRTGVVAGLEQLEIAGTFAPGLSIDSRGGAPNCTSILGKLDGDTFVYQAAEGPVRVGRIIAMPRRMEFADGSSWETPKPPLLGDPATAP